MVIISSLRLRGHRPEGAGLRAGRSRAGSGREAGHRPEGAGLRSGLGVGKAGLFHISLKHEMPSLLEYPFFFAELPHIKIME